MASELKSPVDVLKLLPKTNCRDCGRPTCLTFAVAVMQGEKQLSDCPHYQGENMELAGGLSGRSKVAEDMEKAMEAMRAEMANLDLAAAAARLELQYDGGKVKIPVLGRDYFVDQQGAITSQCHVIMWLAIPIFNYLMKAKGVRPTGDWVPLRDTKGGADWWRLFGQRCEKPLKKVIDEHTDLLELIVEIFAGEPAPDGFDSDIAVVVHPLPHVPVLICYWRPDDGMESSLHMFFDAKVEENLSIESVYYICTGMVVMFEKIAQTHG